MESLRAPRYSFKSTRPQLCYGGELALYTSKVAMNLVRRSEER